MLYLICAFLTLTISLIGYMFINYLIRKREHIYRIKKYVNVQAEIIARKQPKNDLKTGLSFIGNTVSRLSIFDNYKIRVQKELIKAHVLLKGEEFITLSIISAAVFTLIFSVMLGNIAVGILFSIFGWIAPWFVIKRKKKKRVQLLNDQLADAIVLISNSLKAGHSFIQSVEMVSKEMPAPIGEEFGQLQKEVNLGYTTEQALENMVNRIESDDLGLLITAVLTQRQIGGNLAEILDNISGTIRDRLKIKGEIRTLTAQGRVSGAIISCVPVGLAIILQITNPEYMGLLFKSAVGYGILGIAIVMQLVGIYSINKIVRIEI